MLNFGFFCVFIFPTILSLLDILSDILYITVESFCANSLFLACFYCQFTLFIGSIIFYVYFHMKDESSNTLSFLRILCRSFELTILTELNLAHFIPAIWDLDEDPEFDFNDSFRLKILGIQEIFHTVFQSTPQFIIQLVNNLVLGQWNSLSIISLCLSGAFLLKMGYKTLIAYRIHKNKWVEPIYMEL